MSLIDTLANYVAPTKGGTSLDLYQPGEDKLLKARRVVLDHYKPDRGKMSTDFDPTYLVRQMGYKDRISNLSFDFMRRFAQALGVIGAIIQVRSNQVAAFAQPWRQTRTLGFQIRHKDRDHSLTQAEREVIKKFEHMFMNCGRGPNPYERGRRPDLESMLKMSTRDTLMFDQDCVEIIPDQRGIPYSWHQVDASLFRVASPNVVFSKKSEHGSLYGQAVPVYEPSFVNALDKTTYDADDVSYVQVIRDQIVAVYTEDDLLFSTRNPTTWIYNHGYGYSEIEMVVSILTNHLNAEKYNHNVFRQGALPEGILNINDENLDPEMLDAFKREWRAMVSGYENHFKMPILQAKGIQFVPTGHSQKDAEYMKWLEYLIKVTTAVFLIDPSEINFSMMGGFSRGDQQFESNNENRIKFSKDKGLRPILRFQAKKMQRILDKIDDHFMFEFVGLDELTEQERLDHAKVELSSYKTMNEVRADMDLPPIEAGDVPMNATYIQWLQVQQQAAHQQQVFEHEQEQAQQEGAPQQEQQEQPKKKAPAKGKEKDGKGKSSKKSTSGYQVGSKGGVPTGWTSGDDPRMRYANEKPQLDDHKKSLRKTIELVIEE